MRILRSFLNCWCVCQILKEKELTDPLVAAESGVVNMLEEDASNAPQSLWNKSTLGKDLHA